MDITEFLGIAVVGALMSLFIEATTTEVSNPTLMKAITIILAIVVGGLYVWVRSTPYFQTVITVLGASSIVYGFFLNKK